MSDIIRKGSDGADDSPIITKEDGGSDGSSIIKTPEGGKPGTWEALQRWASSKSLWILFYCTGCGAVELPPVMTSRYDAERFGMGPMATPRQADIFLITGYINRKTLKRIIKSYEQMHPPKYVVAHGSCPINGGIYWDSYATAKKLDLYIPVDMWVAGCMPRPEAVYDALLGLMDDIRAGKAQGWKDYDERFQWYKNNQRKVFGGDFI